MNKSYLIVPDWDNLQKSAAIAKKYGAAFEYDDFFNPAVYSDDAQVEERIKGYLALGRDTSKDTLHGAFLDMAPISNDPVIRAHCRNLMERSFSIARRLGCRGVVFHTGLLTGLRLPSYRQGWLDNMEPLYRELCGAYPELELYLENSLEQEPDLLVEMARRMENVPNFKLCLDYAHADLADTPAEAWARVMSPYIGHVHLNDNDGVSDLHLVPGEGTVDFSRFYRISKKFFPDTPVLLELSGADCSEKALEFMTRFIPGEETVRKSKRINVKAAMLMDVLDTTLAISREKDKTALLNLILTKSMDIARCDAGTLYVLKDNGLQFKIMKTLSMGVDMGGKGEPISLPPVALRRSHVCAYSALEGKVVNVPDVYKSEEFDFSGPKNYDKMTGYTTRSMLTVPLMDQNSQVLGVMQLLNAKNDAGQLCAFDQSLERIIEILAAQATITLQQVNYIEEIRSLLWSFTAAMAEAIDQRTPYNGSHTRKVAEYAGVIAQKINEHHEKGDTPEYFDDSRREQLVMAALLHDIGKMVVPTAVMNKATRLGDREEQVYQRMELLRAKLRVAFLEGRVDAAAYERQLNAMNEAEELVRQCNTAGFIVPDKLAMLKEKLETVYTDGEETIPCFLPEEKTSMLVQKGTLTQDERAIMEGHVTSTASILSKVHFNSDYRMAPVFAAQHHEYLNGKGYPNGISGDELPLESRILAVADICDALLAADRPYKKAMPKDRAFQILRTMAYDEGSLEGYLVEYLAEALES